MSIVYNKLFQTIKEHGVTEYYLRKHGISPSILAKIKPNADPKIAGGLEHRTIGKLCKLLNCQPGDIMEWVDDGKDFLDREGSE